MYMANGTECPPVIYGCDNVCMAILNGYFLQPLITIIFYGMVSHHHKM